MPALETGAPAPLSCWTPRRAPEFVAKTVEVLQKDPSIVLCQSQVKVIDEDGNEITNIYYHAGHASSTNPSRVR